MARWTSVVRRLELRHLRRLNPRYLRHNLRALAALRRNDVDDEHLRLFLAWYLTDESNCVDVGAHRGGVLGDLVRRAPSGRHFAFEPLPSLAEGLRVEFPGVEVREMALAATPGEATFHHVRSNPGMSGLRRLDYGRAERVDAITVRVSTLDEELPDDYPADFVKIDVEGAELGVLEGGMGTLKRCRPAIAFEHGISAHETFGTPAREVWAVLAEELDMRIFDMDGEGPLDAEAFARASEGPRWNFLALPERRE